MNINVLRRITPRWLIFSIDIMICFVSIFLSYCLRFNFHIPVSESSTLPYILLIVVGIRGLSFLFGKTYAGMVRYTGTKDIMRIFLVILIGSFTFFVLNMINSFFNEKYFIPQSVIIIDFFITTFILSFSRLLLKNIYNEFNSSKHNNVNTLIYGSGKLALSIKKTIENDINNKYRVVGFIDHHTKITGNKIDGIKVYSINSISSIFKEKQIAIVIISDKLVPISRKQYLVDVCLKNDVEVKIIPSASAWINGEINLNKLKNIRIEDLLERDEIKMSKESIKSNIVNKIILVTGAAGSIGSELVRQLSEFLPKKIILFDIAETPLYEIELEMMEKFNFHNIEIIIGDIRNEKVIDKIFNTYRPNYIFHAAAYKHVPMMEHNPFEAVSVNIVGTKTIADAACKYKADKFVMISTDKAVNPTNVMGASKRIAEIYIQTLNNSNESTKFITTRFGNVLGSNGSVIPRFKKQIEAGGPVTITHPEVTRFFMTIPEACQLVLEAENMGNGGEIFIFDMGKPVKILNLAQKMIYLSGLKPEKDIKIKCTGLRPGEKLYEELLADKENTLQTYHEQIMIAKVREYNQNFVNDEINNLIEISNGLNDKEIVAKMKEIVPEFISNNSIYEMLDNKQEVNK